MFQLTLFDVYRRLLLIIAGVYSVMGLVRLLRAWHAAARRGPRPQRMALRYAEVLALRLRLRRFRSELVQIAALGAVLLGLISLHGVWLPE